MTRTSNQSGFAAVETLLIIIILAIIGFTGWYVWRSKQSTDKTLTGAAQTSQSTKTPTVAKKSVPAAAKYLTITQWNVKIPLASAISDAYYSYDSSKNVVYLSTDTYKGTNCAADQVSLGAISRFAAGEKDADNGATMLSENPTAVMVGGNYYFYTHPQAACDGGTTNSTANLDAAKSATASAQMTDFQQAAAKIEATN